MFDWLAVEFEDQNDAIWMNTCLELLDNLRKVVDNFGTKMSKLSTENVTLKNHQKILEEKMKKLEAAQQELIVGQVAFMTDEAILTYVIENPKERDIYSISQMEKALFKKCHFEDAFTDEERPFYHDRWDELKKKIGWGDKHFRSLVSLKEIGIKSAYDSDELKKAIERACIEESLKTRCKDLLGIFEVRT